MIDCAWSHFPVEMNAYMRIVIFHRKVTSAGNTDSMRETIFLDKHSINCPQVPVYQSTLSRQCSTIYTSTVILSHASEVGSQGKTSTLVYDIACQKALVMSEGDIQLGHQM